MKPVWPHGPPKPQLLENDAHVWLAELDVRPDRLAYLESLLSDSERARAARFRFDRHRDRYTAGRGMLRELLGRYLDHSPDALQISYSDYGKPYLAAGELRFNLAHSRDLALFGFVLGDAVGVDIEAQRELPDAMAVARRFFSPVEYAALQALPPEQQIAAFFRCWSCKEAFIKAVGEGLSYPLDSFDVSLAPADPARLLTVRGSEREALNWSLSALDLPAGYYGALVVERPIAKTVNVSTFSYQMP